MPHSTVTGGAGFLGSHLVDRLVELGHEVTVVDNFITGLPENVSPHAQFINADVCTNAWMRQVKDTDYVFHLASPASPGDYLEHPLETMMVNSVGTYNMLNFAKWHQATFLVTSTSEVYGDPLIHPQPEDYWGNVNPVGPRSCYDESKRFTETLTNLFQRYTEINTITTRLFNTYGPRMRPKDGRVISTFVRQCLAGEPMTVFGDGSQTRSLCFVDDTVRGLIRAAAIGHPGPINIGSEYEFTVLEIAHLVADVLAVEPVVEFHPLPTDDPTQRRPDLTLARTVLEWEPETEPREGIRKTAEWMAAEMAANPLETTTE